MKKVISILSILLLSIGLFAGCGNNDESKQKSQNQPNKASKVSTEKSNSQEEKKNNDMVKQENTDEVIFTDAFGDEVTLKKSPKRVVCLYNSFLDLWYEAGGTVVGRIETKGKVPVQAENAELVGTMSQVNVEKLLELKPDLVILRNVHAQAELVPIFKENNIAYLATDYTNLDEFMKYYKIYTELNNRDDLFETKGKEILGKIEEIKNKIPKDVNPKVLLLFGTSKRVSAKLPNSQVGAMLNDLGAVNIAYDAQLSEEEMQTFSMEKIIQRDPDFIFVQTMGSVEKVQARMTEDVEKNPAWGSLRAVKEKKYIYLDKNLYLYKPNMRYAEAYEGLAKILYPEVFGE